MSIVSSKMKECVRGTRPRTHFFNPGYESSVALGDKSYTPSGMVQMMRHDLWELPYYYADKGDIVLCPYDLPSSQDLSGYELCPWGWAPELRYGRLSELVPYSYDEMKQWSSRHNTYLLLSELIRLYPDVYSEDILPQVIDPTLPSIVIEATKSYVLKEEFSSSGRGVVFAKGAEISDLIRRRQNKSSSKRLYLEPRHNKISDRGYEFVRQEDGKVIYVGPSDFYTTEGRYNGNRVERPEIIHERWRSTATSVSHDTYVNHLVHAIEALPLGRYHGPIGIDTMVHEEGGRLHLHPCIEVNVRPTMGWLALALGERYLGDNTTGLLELKYYSSPEVLQKELRPTLTSTTPLYRSTQNTPLPPGRYLLTTLTPETRFVAILTISHHT